MHEKKDSPPIRFSGGLFFYFFSLASTWSRATKERKKAPRGIVRLMQSHTAKAMLDLCGVLLPTLIWEIVYETFQIKVIADENYVVKPAVLIGYQFFNCFVFLFHFIWCHSNSPFYHILGQSFYPPTLYTYDKM